LKETKKVHRRLELPPRPPSHAGLQYPPRPTLTAGRKAPFWEFRSCTCT
jgi:hypothetical protein